VLFHSLTSLTLLSFAVYGLAWTITKSSLFFDIRAKVFETFGPDSKLTKLINCIVCTSFWVSFFILFINEDTFTFNLSFTDYLTWAFYSVAFTWMVGLSTGDAS
jgi:hypothetical protein